MNKRKLKYGSASAVYIALFIAILIVINLAAGALTDRFSLKLDLTSGGQFSLSSDTEEMLKTLTGDISIYILSTQADMERNDIGSRTLETVQRYVSSSGGRVSYSFIDPNKNPRFFEKYLKAKGSGERSLVIEGPERYTVVKSGELAYTVSGDKSNRVFYQTEELISAAILYVSSPEISAAGFITGHSEAEAGALRTILSGNNFDISTVDLIKGIPENVNNLILAAPKTDFTADEISALESFLSKDKNTLYVFGSVSSPSLPVLERYLAEWGIAFEAEVVCDEDNAYGTPIFPLGEVVENELIDTENQGQLMPIFPSTRPIKLLFTEGTYKRVVPVMQSMKGSYSKALSVDKKIEVLTRESGDKSGPFTLAAISERGLGKNGIDGVTRIVVFGTEGFADEQIAATARAYNSEFLTAVVAYANPSTLTMDISPKVQPSFDLNITTGLARTLQILLIFVLPATILAMGIFVFVRRKNR